MMPVPMTEPMMVPRPPNRLAPPMTTAAMALRLSVAPEAGEPAPSRAITSTAATPASDTGQQVDLEQVPPVVDPGPDHRLPAVPDAQRVGAEPGLGQQQRRTRS